MFHRIPLLSAAIALVTSLPAAAQSSYPAGSDEFSRNRNLPAPQAGTHESRQADRRLHRSEVKRQAQAGELPTAGDDWGMGKNMPSAVEGTHETRSAERSVKRAELKQVVRAGQLPATDEADVGRLPNKAP